MSGGFISVPMLLISYFYNYQIDIQFFSQSYNYGQMVLNCLYASYGIY